MKCILISVLITAAVVFFAAEPVAVSAERRCACSRNSGSDEKLAWIKLYEDINYKGKYSLLSAVSGIGLISRTWA